MGNHQIYGTYELNITRATGERESFEFNNLVTNEGMALMMRVATQPGSTSPQWFLGLKGEGTPSKTDTARSHPAWSEVGGYSEPTRPSAVVTLENGGLSGRVAPIELTITEETRVYGAFLISTAPKLGNIGTILSVADFPARRVLFAGDKIGIGYRFSIMPATQANLGS